MKARLLARTRIARVRAVEHLRAVGAAATAEARAGELQASATRLEMLRSMLAPAPGAAAAAALAHAGELAGRLDQASAGLAAQIAAAKDVVALRESERRAAHVARESAARLQVRAVHDMRREIERRLAAGFRPRIARACADD